MSLLNTDISGLVAFSGNCNRSSPNIYPKNSRLLQGSHKIYGAEHREARLLPMLTKRLHYYRLRLPSLGVMMRKKLNSGLHFISCRHLNHHICSVCRWLFFYCLTFAALLTFSERGIVRMLWAISFHRMTSHAITTDSMRHAHDHTSIVNDSENLF